MKTLFATLLDKSIDLSEGAKCVNNGRTDDVSFYVNNGRISVSNTYREMSESEQESELKWFLGLKKYEIN